MKTMLICFFNTSSIVHAELIYEVKQMGRVFMKKFWNICGIGCRTNQCVTIHFIHYTLPCTTCAWSLKSKLLSLEKKQPKQPQRKRKLNVEDIETSVTPVLWQFQQKRLSPPGAISEITRELPLWLIGRKHFFLRFMGSYLKLASLLDNYIIYTMLIYQLDT